MDSKFSFRKKFLTKKATGQVPRETIRPLITVVNDSFIPPEISRRLEQPAPIVSLEPPVPPISLKIPRPPLLIEPPVLDESGNELTVGTQMIEKIRDLGLQLRILVIGRANSGKTTIIQKLCDIDEEPIVHDENGNQLPAPVLNGPTAMCDLHDINIQITYRSKPGFIFHDSRGFEVDSLEEFDAVKDFIQAMLAKPDPKDRLHAIWYCIPFDRTRVASKAELSFFQHAIVPVIVLFTKWDGRIIRTFNWLQYDKDMSISLAKQRAPLLAKQILEEEFIPTFKDTADPPVSFVVLGYMNKPETKCNGLLERTAAALEGLVWPQTHHPPPLALHQPNSSRYSTMIPPLDNNDLLGDQADVFHGPSAGVNHIALSPPPSSQSLGSGSSDKTIQSWNAESGADVATRKGHSEAMESTAFQNASGQESDTATPQLAEPTQATTNSQEDVVVSASTSTPLSNDITGSVSLAHSERVGLGGFGDLFLGNHTNQGKVALKRPHRFFDDASIRRFLREVDLWCNVSHRYVLPCLGTCKIGPDVYLVSPFIENGDLRSCIARGVVLNRRKLLYEVVEALAHLHHSSIVHGDVKGQNILVSAGGSALLCDFGLAKAFDSMVTSTQAKGAGSTRWMAPELFEDASRSMASDVYSFGITIAEVLSGQEPFPDISNNVAVIFYVMFKNGRPPKAPLHSSKGESYLKLWETAEKCWAREVEARPSMAQVLDMLFPLAREKN